MEFEKNPTKINISASFNGFIVGFREIGGWVLT
jgi:hypothetical protein